MQKIRLASIPTVACADVFQTDEAPAMHPPQNRIGPSRPALLSPHPALPHPARPPSRPRSSSLALVPPCHRRGLPCRAYALPGNCSLFSARPALQSLFPPCSSQKPRPTPFCPPPYPPSLRLLPRISTVSLFMYIFQFASLSLAPVPFPYSSFPQPAPAPLQI